MLNYSVLATHTLKCVLSIVIALLLFQHSDAQPLHWQKLANNLDYAVIYPNPTDHSGKLHAFRFSAKQYRLSSVFAADGDVASSFVSLLGRQHHALIAINGGFFSPQLKPLGLRIANGTLRNPLKGTSWWGVFTLNKQGRANILAKSAYHPSKNIDFAIQAGPRLIINGKIPKLKAGESERSALCITRNKKIIIAITQNAPLSTMQLASLMLKKQQQGGLNCQEALNLDGGSSSQLFANIGSFQLNIPSIRGVTDAIIVTHR